VSEMSPHPGASDRPDSAGDSAAPYRVPAPASPLARNRNYRLLWSSQAMSGFGTNASMIAFPLLALALTGDATASGLILGAMAAAQLVAGLPAGALVDRWNRKRILLICEAAHATSAASLVAALWWGVATVPHMILVAVIMGVCAALFEPAEEASLGRVVPPDQLSTALAMNSARDSLGHLAGTAAGGFLFAFGRMIPFAVDALAHVAGFFTLLTLRMPVREASPEPAEPPRLGRDIAEGMRWVWHHRPIRVTALCAVALNLFFSAFYIVVIVRAEAAGVSSGEIGVMAAMLGVGGIIGAMAAPALHRIISPSAAIIGVFWILTVFTPIAALADGGYFTGVLLAAMALLPPTANTTIMSRQLLLTPDELRGRLSAVIGLVTGVAATLGPVVGGLLMEFVSGDRAILLCASGIAAVTMLVTASPTLRHFPRHHPAEESAAIV